MARLLIRYRTFTTPSTACNVLLSVVRHSSSRTTGGNHMIILGCESRLNQLAAVDVILMDGTFDYCLKFLAQDLPSTVRRMDITYLWFSACLSIRSRTATEPFFFVTKINDKLCNFSLKEINVDFEVAIHNVAQIKRPLSQITGCWFEVTKNRCVTFLKCYVNFPVQMITGGVIMLIIKFV